MIRAYTYNLSQGGRGYGVALNNESYYVVLDSSNKRSSWGHFFRKLKETQAIFYETGKSNEIPRVARHFLIERIFKG